MALAGRIQPGSFLYRGYAVDAATGTLTFDYAFDNGPQFTEVIRLGHPIPELAPHLRPDFDRAVAMLYALSGVSYYKLYAPHRLDLGGLSFTACDMAFLHDIFAQGLGEFAYRNQLDLADRLIFENWHELAPAAPRIAVAEGPIGRSAVLVGGGKDSLVSIEAMRQSGLPFDLFAVNPRQPMTDCARLAGKDLLAVVRDLSPDLFALNGQPGTYNGHVPITAIVSMIAVVGSFIHGYSNVILSNERSADEANIRDGDTVVNHQFSKTSAFEKAFQDYVAQFAVHRLRYFSLLRPLSEIQIAELFARTDRYDAVFTSCNKAFRLQDRPDARWCGDCAKCRFTFLLMARPMGKDRLCRIFGANLLDDPAQYEGFLALTGLQSHKPWDCVGEEREAIVLLTLLRADPAWHDSTVITRLAPLLPADDPDNTGAIAHELAQYMAPAWGQSMPEAFAGVLRDYVG